MTGASYESYKEAVERALRGHPLLQGPDEPVTQADPTPPPDGAIPQPLRSAMRYSLLLPGKRLRPVLLLASYALLADDWARVLPYACALEMIHTYSLIHDDLPALDNDALRRGQPTNHRVFGENIAILAGDALLQLAFETMLEAPFGAEHPRRALLAIREIAVRAGVRGMIAGQTLDVKLEDATPEPELVGYIHRHKTADLLTAPVTAGLTLAGADKDQLEAGRKFGQGLGVAFQIVDDLLDLHGDVVLMGKEAGMDAQRGKMTWPAVYGEERSRDDAERQISSAVAALAVFGERADFLRALAQQTLVRAR